MGVGAASTWVASHYCNYHWPPPHPQGRGGRGNVSGGTARGLEWHSTARRPELFSCRWLAQPASPQLRTACTENVTWPRGPSHSISTYSITTRARKCLDGQHSPTWHDLHLQDRRARSAAHHATKPGRQATRGDAHRQPLLTKGTVVAFAATCSSHPERHGDDLPPQWPAPA